MTDPLNPDHAEPAEGPRDDAYSSSAGAKTARDAGTGAGQPAGSAAARASDMFETIRDTVEDLAEKATPAVRQFSAKAADMVAIAADRAVPLVQKAGEATADASGKLAEKSRTWAADLRESMSGKDDGSRPSDTSSYASGAAQDDARDVAKDNPPL